MPRKIRINFEYDSDRSDRVAPTQPVPTQIITQDCQSQVQPAYGTPQQLAPTRIQSPVAVIAPPTKISDLEAYKRGAAITSAVVVAIVGIQLYPPAWNWIESQPPVKELQKVFGNLPGAKAKPRVKLSKLDFQSPQKGDSVANTQFYITSPWGHRNIDVPGASHFHQGVDVNCPEGTPVRAIGLPGELLKVKAAWDNTGTGGNFVTYTSKGLNKTFQYLHLSSAKAGIFKPGDIIGYTGHSGTQGGDHLHFQQRDENNEKEPPYRIYIEAALTGKLRSQG